MGATVWEEKIYDKNWKEFEINYLATIPYPDQVYIRIVAPISTVAEVFSQKEETVEMKFEDIVLSGYTNLASIIPEPDVIRVCLRREN